MIDAQEARRRADDMHAVPAHVECEILSASSSGSYTARVALSYVPQIVADKLTRLGYTVVTHASKVVTISWQEKQDEGLPRT